METYCDCKIYRFFNFKYYPAYLLLLHQSQHTKHIIHTKTHVPLMLVVFVCFFQLSCVLELFGLFRA